MPDAMIGKECTNFVDELRMDEDAGFTPVRGTFDDGAPCIRYQAFEIANPLNEPIFASDDCKDRSLGRAQLAFSQRQLGEAEHQRGESLNVVWPIIHSSSVTTSMTQMSPTLSANRK